MNTENKERTRHCRLVNVSKIKGLAREHGKRVGEDFLAALEGKIHDIVVKACGVHNGTKKTLDATVMFHVAG